MVSGSAKSLGRAARSWAWARAAAACPAAGRPGHSRRRPVAGVQVYIRARSVIGGKLVLGVVSALVDGKESLEK